MSLYISVQVWQVCRPQTFTHSHTFTHIYTVCEYARACKSGSKGLHGEHFDEWRVGRR